MIFNMDISNCDVVVCTKEKMIITHPEMQYTTALMKVKLIYLFFELQCYNQELEQLINDTANSPNDIFYNLIYFLIQQPRSLN